MNEITETSLAAEILAQHGERTEVYALDTESSTFKTTETFGEGHWAFDAEGNVTPITYWEYCDRNGFDPDFG